MDRIKLHEKYRPLWSSGANYFIVTGGRGSGKSFAVSDFIENLTFEQGHTILFTRYTLTSAHLSIIPEFEEKIELEEHFNYFDVNKTDIVNRATGSSIVFRGIKTSSGNQTASLKSIQNVTTWVLDEAEELTDEETFDKIDESIRKKGIQNRVIILLNPCTKEHFIYRRFFQDMGVEAGFNGTVGNVTYIHSDYLDNKDNLNEKFLIKAEQMKQNNPSKYNHIMLGGWLEKAEGVIFDNWKFGEFDNTLPYVYGLDFGSTDPDGLVKIAVDDKNKKLYIKEELYQNGMGTNELLQRVSSIVGNGLVVGDSASPRTIQDLKNGGINIKPAIKAKITDDIKAMSDYQFIIEGSNLARELNTWVWLDKRGEYPLDDNNHLIDPSRYAFNYLTKPKNKGILYSGF